MVNNMEMGHFKYLFLLHLTFFSALQVFEYFVGLERINISLPIACETSLFYVILGYFIDNNIKKLSKKSAGLLAALSLASIAFSTYMVFWNITKNHAFTDGDKFMFSKALIVFPTVTVFLFCKFFFKTENEKLGQCLKWIGGATFGLYLLEVIFERMTFDIYFIAKRLVPPFLAWLIWLGSILVVAVLSISIYKGCVIGIKKLIKRSELT
jgi:surface polysaccharide O-acyltransferase-like enzyme